MLGDVRTRSYSYGGNREKSIDPTIFYEKFKVRCDLIASDETVEEYTNLLEIFREMKDDDHADEFREDTSAEMDDVDHNRIEEVYAESEIPEKTDYPMLLQPPEHENQDTSA